MMKIPVPNTAIKRMQQCREEQNPFLDLGECGLQDIPDEIGAFSWLRSLNLGKVYLVGQNWDQQIETSNSGPANKLSESDMQALKQLPQLEELFLHGLDLRSLTFLAGMPNLKVLWLNFNQLGDLAPVQQLKELQVLSIAVNKVRDLSPCAGLTKLRMVNVSGNQLESLAGLEGHKSLSQLFFANNQISNIDSLNKLTGLQTLWGRNNKISDIGPLDKLVNLIRVNLSYNTIKDISPIRNLSKLIQLELASNNISDLEPIARLEHINYLDISENYIASLPEQLKDPLRVEKRSFITEEGYKKLGKDAEFMRSASLENVSEAELSRLGQKIDSSYLETHEHRIYPWQNLVELHLSANELTDCSALQHLTNLTVLKLRGNKISQLDFLENLKSLAFLDLAQNAIETPDHLAQLNNLATLDLCNNQIRQIEPLTALPQLKDLALDQNPIEGVPLEIALSRDINQIIAYFTALKKDGKRKFAEVKLILIGNSTAGKTSLSKVLRGKKFDAKEKTTHGIQIRAWTIDAKESAEQPESTDLEQVFVNIWDFGGQEYYHGTHRLFMVNNAVYVIVWENATNRNAVIPTEVNTGKDREMLPLEQFTYAYWLENIRFYARDQQGVQPPVLLIQNKIDMDGGRWELPDPNIKKDYQITEVFPLSLRWARSRQPAHRSYLYRYEIFQDSLLRTILEQAVHQANKEHLPVAWMRVREHIRQLGNGGPETADSPFRPLLDDNASMSGEQFRAACAADYWAPGLQATEANVLLQYLNAVGAVLYVNSVQTPEGGYQEDRVYFDPIKLTQKIYQILNETVRQQNGLLSLPIAKKALGDEKKARQMLALMARWRIIFPAPQKDGSGAPTWIAPQYLPADHPLEDLFNIALSGLMQHFYAIRMPLFHFKTIMRHLVYFFGISGKSHSKEFWKNGILLVTRESELRILIKGIVQPNEPDHGQILVCVEKKARKERETDSNESEIFLEMVRAMQNERSDLNPVNMTASTRGGVDESESMLATVNTKMKAFTISRNGEDFVGLTDLFEQARQGIGSVLSTRLDGKPGRRMDVKDFSVFLEALQIAIPKPSLFISYSHSDKPFLDELEIHLATTVKRLKDADIWNDKMIMAGDDWDEQIKSNLRSADIVILLISANFIASNYIWEHELAEALERAGRGEARVIPILLSECLWQGMPFAQFEMLPKDEAFARLLPIDQWTNRAKAFTQVARRIQEAVTELKM